MEGGLREIKYPINSKLQKKFQWLMAPLEEHNQMYTRPNYSATFPSDRVHRKLKAKYYYDVLKKVQ